MDKSAEANRTNQCNPTHQKTGPGHQAAYQGTGTQADKDNHANQGNPNSEAYKSSREGNKK